MGFNVGRFAAPPSLHYAALPADAVERAALLDAAPLGSPYSLFGLSFVLTPRHLRPAALESWRAQGDDVADAAFAALDALRADAASAVSACVAAVRRGSHDTPLAAVVEAHAGDDAAIAALRAAVMNAPPWVDWAAMSTAVRFYRRHAPALGIALLHLSLVGGFGAPRINAVLVAAGGLCGASDNVYTRLLETLQLVDDCFGDGGDEATGDDGTAALRPGGRGWASVVAVRLLHSSVRARLLPQRRYCGAHGGVDGVKAAEGGAGAPAAGAACPFAAAGAHPINQEDMLTTQLAFGIVPLIGLERIGAMADADDGDVDAWLHAWRYVGYLLGVDEALGADSGTRAGAQVLLESTTAHLMAPDSGSAELARGVLLAAARRPPLYWSLAQGVAATRVLAGAELADALGVVKAAAGGGAAAEGPDATSLRGWATLRCMAAEGVPWTRIALRAILLTALSIAAMLASRCGCARRDPDTAAVAFTLAALATAPRIAGLPCGVGAAYTRITCAATRGMIRRGLGGRCAFLPRAWLRGGEAAPAVAADAAKGADDGRGGAARQRVRNRRLF